MRRFLELFWVIVLGLALGGSLSWYSIQSNHGFGAINIGQWTAWPLAGSKDADPYTKAKVAADGEVPLGVAEGIAFHALLDQSGKPLQLECQYQLSGQTPTARFWTLAAHQIEGNALITGDGSSPVLLSQTILRESDGRFVLNVGPNLAVGNWLLTQGFGPYQLILRLYDTPFTSANGVVNPEMPEIELLGCAS